VEPSNPLVEIPGSEVIEPQVGIELFTRVEVVVRGISGLGKEVLPYMIEISGYLGFSRMFSQTMSWLRRFP